MNRARLLPGLLVMAFAPLVQADDAHPAAQKPAASAPAAASKPTAAPADDELLEFLGSLDEESDGEWIDYLLKTDIPQATQAKSKTPAATETSDKP